MRKKSAFFLTGMLTLILSSGLNAQWEHINNLNGAHVNALSEKETYLFADTRDNGVFRSGDSGVSWLGVNTGLTSPDIRSLAIRGTYLFAGTYGGGIFRAKDSARVWYPFNTGLPDTAFVTALARTEDTLSAAQQNGINMICNQFISHPFPVG